MGDLWGPEARALARAESAERYRMGRCEHGMLGPICPVKSCRNWDGVDSNSEAEHAGADKRQRRCIRCRELKGRRSFYGDSARPGKLRSECISCSKKAVYERLAKKKAAGG